MGAAYPNDFVLRSNVEWCPARYALETEAPLGETYRLNCPSCKSNHAFTVVIHDA